MSETVVDYSAETRISGMFFGAKMFILHSFLLYFLSFRPDVLLCNGPGTCIPVCFAAAMFDLLRLRDTRIFFIESICRVKSLSLSALILYYLRIPDSIIVQWRDLSLKYPNTEFIDDL